MPQRSRQRRKRFDRTRHWAEQTRVVPAALLLVVVTSIGLLIGAYATGPLADAWHPVVAVNGDTSNRTDLRGRMALDEALLVQREATVRSFQATGLISASEADRIRRSLDGARSDPLRAAVDGLVADRLILEAIRSRGMAVDIDVPAEIRAASTADVWVHFTGVTIQPPIEAPAPGPADWPRPPRPDAPAEAIFEQLTSASEHADRALAGGADPETVAASLVDAGWRAVAWDQWFPRAGAVDGIPDAMLTATRSRSGQPGSVPPVVDRLRLLAAAGMVNGGGPTPTDQDELDGVDADALRRWAEARASERALQGALEDAWRATPQALVRAREIVIGSASVEGAEGEYRSFAHLVVSQLPSEVVGGLSPTDVAATLAEDLRSLAPSDRLVRFGDLVRQANTTPKTDPLLESGEMGYFTKDALVPAIAEPAFNDEVQTDDLVGPVTTSVGPELLVVRGIFHGRLDERANAALVEARGTPDLLSMAKRVAPLGEWVRALGTEWRSEAELAGSEDAGRAYQVTEIASLSDPFVLEDEILLVIPEERRAGIPDEATLARLVVRGFDAWLAGQIGRAAIVRDPEPLPGVIVDAEATGGSPQPTFGVIPTPNLPSILLP